MFNNAFDFEIMMLFNQHKGLKVLCLKMSSFKPVLETPDECSANSVKSHFFLVSEWSKKEQRCFPCFFSMKSDLQLDVFNETPFYRFSLVLHKKKRALFSLSYESQQFEAFPRARYCRSSVIADGSQIKTMFLSGFCARKCHHNLLLISEETCHVTTGETVTLSTAQHIAIRFIITISVMAWF